MVTNAMILTQTGNTFYDDDNDDSNPVTFLMRCVTCWHRSCAENLLDRLGVVSLIEYCRKKVQKSMM